MTTAPRDENNVPAKLACLNTDTVQGTTLVPITITPQGIKTNKVDTAQFTLKPVAPKDENYVNVWLFKGNDGLTYPAVADATGALLINQL